MYLLPNIPGLQTFNIVNKCNCPFFERNETSYFKKDYKINKTRLETDVPLKSWVHE